MPPCSADQPHRLFTAIIAGVLLGVVGLTSSPTISAAEESGGADLQRPEAQEKRSPTPPPPTATLPEITVSGVRESASAASTLTHDDIERLPLRNSSLQELLRVLPGVQLSEFGNLSAQGGELLPPANSFVGGTVDQNTFQLDGMSLDSKLDPLADNPNDLDDVPGNPVTMAVNPWLIDTIELHDYNVAARYGHFSAAAVVVKTREPLDDFSGKARFHTTRSNWTRFHLAPEEKEQFAASTDYYRQPRFEKYESGIMLDVPFASGHGLIFDHQRNRSTIPLHFLDGSKTQHRELEQTYVKWRSQLTSAAQLTASFQHAPSHSSYFTKNALNSDFTVTNGGTGLQAAYLHEAAGSRLEITGAAQQSANNRRAPDEWRSWKTSPEKHWGTLINSGLSLEGGFGDLDRKQENLSLAAHWSVAPLHKGGHQPALGIEAERVKVSHARKHTTYIYNTATQNSSVTCGNDTTTCVSGDQYFSTRNIYPAYRTEAVTNTIGLYAQTALVYRKFSLQPGARLDFDSLSENLDLAPRLAIQWALDEAHSNTITVGLNRYYGSQSLTSNLLAGRPSYIIEKRTLTGTGTTPGSWSYSSQSYPYQRSSLATPYSDELSVEWKTPLGGGENRLVALQRSSRDELARELGSVQTDGRRYFVINNRGRSSYRSIRSDWKKTWARQSLDLAVTWQESRTNSEGYTTTLDETIEATPIWYRGQVLAPDELPRSDFNRSWTGKALYTATFPFGLEFTNVTTYRSRFRSIYDTHTDKILADGRVANVYADRIVSPSWTCDWNLRWNFVLTGAQVLTLTCDVFNVFNQRIEVATDFNNERFETGRQFWAGLEYTF